MKGCFVGYAQSSAVARNLKDSALFFAVRGSCQNDETRKTNGSVKFFCVCTWLGSRKVEEWYGYLWHVLRIVAKANKHTVETHWLVSSKVQTKGLFVAAHRLGFSHQQTFTMVSTKRKYLALSQTLRCYNLSTNEHLRCLFYETLTRSTTKHFFEWFTLAELKEWWSNKHIWTQSFDVGRIESNRARAKTGIYSRGTTCWTGWCWEMHLFCTRRLGVKEGVMKLSASVSKFAKVRFEVR